MIKDLTKEFNYVSDSIKGSKRKNNQDGLLAIVEVEYALFIVFDGIGSASNSELAVQFAKDYVTENHSLYRRNDCYNLKNLIIDLNKHILSCGQPEAYTTICALSFVDKSEFCEVAHLGDSRLYTFSNQFVSQVTQDDRLPGTNRLSKYLGMDSLMEHDIPIQKIQQVGNSFLLCTDGFYSILESNKMRFFKILNYRSFKRTWSQLRKEVINNNSDDSTYIIIK